jgi:hypothetical protein
VKWPVMATFPAPSPATGTQQEDSNMSSKNDKPVVEVHTSKRSYTWLGPRQVTWQKGEKVKSMEAKDRGKGGKK